MRCDRTAQRMYPALCRLVLCGDLLEPAIPFALGWREGPGSVARGQAPPAADNTTSRRHAKAPTNTRWILPAHAGAPAVRLLRGAARRAARPLRGKVRVPGCRAASRCVGAPRRRARPHAAPGAEAAKTGRRANFRLRGMWASRSKQPNPHLLLPHQSPPITLGGAHAARVNGHTIHTLRIFRGGAGGWWGNMMRLPQGGRCAGRGKVVMCPCRGRDPASGHPGAQKPPLGRIPQPPVWGCQWTRHRAVKQGPSGGTRYQSKGVEGGIDSPSRERNVWSTAQGGERPMGTATFGGNGLKEKARVSGERPIALPVSESNSSRGHANPPSLPTAAHHCMMCNPLVLCCIPHVKRGEHPPSFTACHMAGVTSPL